MINAQYTVHAACRPLLIILAQIFPEVSPCRYLYLYRRVICGQNLVRNRKFSRVRQVTVTSYLSLLLKVSLVFSVQCHYEEGRLLALGGKLGSPF